jgi:hypothetical protein
MITSVKSCDIIVRMDNLSLSQLRLMLRPAKLPSVQSQSIQPVTTLVELEADLCWPRWRKVTRHFALLLQADDMDFVLSTG